MHAGVHLDRSSNGSHAQSVFGRCLPWQRRFLVRRAQVTSNPSIERTFQRRFAPFGPPLMSNVRQHMSVVACEVPVLSVLDRGLIDGAFFHDSYRAPLSRAPASVVEVFFAIFGHHPKWLKAVLVSRNWLASRFGLEAPTSAEIMRPRVRASYSVGDKIGPWPIFHITETELIAGRDNKHLDFRLSVLKEPIAGGSSTVVSTVCTTHNIVGKLYVLVVIPFHKWGVPRLMSRALAQGRL
jgi:hypothetical protein